MSTPKYSLGITALLFPSATVLAQMTYGPVPAQVVPIPTLLLVPLGITMAVLGYRAIRKHGTTHAIGMLLMLGGLGTVVSSSLSMQDAVAAAFIELSNPQGDTVVLTETPAEYKNTAGVPLRIESVTPPSDCTTSAPIDECVSGLQLAGDAICTVAYVNDCIAFTISITSSSNAIEPATNGAFTISSSVPVIGNVLVSYTVDASSTATPGSDYIALSGTATILDGSDSVQVPVLIKDDSTSEEIEQVMVSLDSSPAYTLGVSNTATVSIFDEDSGTNTPPTVIASPQESFDSFSNTTLQYAATQSATPSVFLSGNLLENFQADSDGPLPLTISLVSASPNAQVTLKADGSFTYLPQAAFVGDDSFQYAVTDGISSVTRTVTVELHETIWYVNNAAAAGGDGRSTAPYNTLAEAESEAIGGDYIFVYRGDGTSTDMSSGITLKSQQKFYGEGYGLSIPLGLNGNASPTVLVAAGLPAKLTNSAGNAVNVLANSANFDRTGIEIRGFEISAASGNGIDIESEDTRVSEVTVSDNAITAIAGQYGIRMAGHVDALIVDNSLAGGEKVILGGTNGTPLFGSQTIKNNDIVHSGLAGGGVASIVGIEVYNGGSDTTVDVSDNRVQVGSIDTFNPIGLRLTGPTLVSSNNDLTMIGIAATGQILAPSVHGESTDNTIDVDAVESYAPGLGLPSYPTGEVITAVTEGSTVTVTGNTINVASTMLSYGQSIIAYRSTVDLTNNTINIDPYDQFTQAYLTLPEALKGLPYVAGNGPHAGQKIWPHEAVISSSGNQIEVLGAGSAGYESPGGLVVQASNKAIEVMDTSFATLTRAQVDLGDNELRTTGTGIYVDWSGGSIAKSSTTVEMTGNTITRIGAFQGASGISLQAAPNCIEMSGNTGMSYVSSDLAYNNPNHGNPVQVANVADLAGLNAANSISSYSSDSPPAFLGLGNACP